MAKSWLKYPQEEFLTTGFDYTSQADTQNSTFLNNNAILPEQINDINDAESFANLDVSTPSDSSEEKTQKWRSDVENLQAEVKTLKETYV